jgi:hypothetical protein
MAQYTGIQGQNILIVSSDPANPTEGQIWYNTTTNLLKGYANVVTNSWASGGNMNTGRIYIGSAGTQTAGLGFGGYAPPTTGATEEYNGTSWANNPTGLGTARYELAGAGTQTAGLAAGGYPGNKTNTEEYDGSTWTAGGALTTGRGSLKGTGTQTAALVAGGGIPSAATPSAVAEQYNGTSWTSAGSLTRSPAKTYGMGSAGIQTAALMFGGYNGTGPGGEAINTELWNGTSWTAVANLNTARYILGGAGIQTAALAFGGSTPASVGSTELYNGTSWTSNPTGLATARVGLGGGGIQTSGIAFAGGTGPGTGTTATEEWTGTVISTKTVTVS